MIAAGELIGGRYRLRSRIGGGGMGAVWLADDERLGRAVAVKHVLAPERADPATATEQRARAMREGRIAARVSHPHAIAIYDVAEQDGQPWLVMEYLPSRSLAAVLAEAGVLRVDQVAQIGAQLADALGAVHAAGIVHRDVKPANVLIGRGDRIEGLVKITDFGISHASGDVTLTQTGMITGTPAYLAPEVARGEEPGAAADVFALGATLYACLEGQPPFGAGDNALQQLHRVAGGAIEPPRRAGALTQPLLRVLAADPGDRPSMRQVRDELASLAAGRDGDATAVLAAPTDITSPIPAEVSTPSASLPATTVLGSTEPSEAPRAPSSAEGRPPPAAWAVAAVVLLVAGLAAAWGIGRDGDPRDDASTVPADATTEVTASSEPPDPTTASDPPDATTEPGIVDEEPAGGDGGGEGGGQVASVRSIERFLDEYHELATDDPAAAYELTGPTLREAIGPAAYADFWSAFDEVRIGSIEVEEDGSALAEVELVFGDGSVQVERHRYRFVEEDGGRLLDRDEFVEVISQRASVRPPGSGRPAGGPRGRSDPG